MSDMGNPPPFRQPLNEGQPIVAFDFDGTLTIRDSFTAFLKWRAGPVGWIRGLASMVPDLALYLFDRNRGRIKAASVRVFLKGMTREALSQDAQRYADEIWSHFMRPDALACWKSWGEKGAHRVIVTASPETTIAPFARRLGAENLIGTQLEFDAQDRVTGLFASENCRRAEKVKRLKAVYGDNLYLLAAYGDTSGDTEMIAMAEEKGFRVFTQKP
jgi:phosphatidylglycerophosphatase C